MRVYASVWTNQYRGGTIEIRGRAELVTGVTPANPYFSDELIRVHPRRILSRGWDPDR